MLKKAITFKDLDGNDVTEDFYFNLSKAEITELQFSKDGGLLEFLRKIINSKDAGQVIGTFKEIVSSCVGKRSEDGRRFIKSQEITDEFLQSDAYSVLFMELLTDAGKAAEFIKGIVPADLAEGITEEKIAELSLPEEETDSRPAYEKEDRLPTDAEMASMNQAEFQKAFAWKQAYMSRPKE